MARLSAALDREIDDIIGTVVMGGLAINSPSSVASVTTSSTGRSAAQSPPPCEELSQPDLAGARLRTSNRCAMTCPVVRSRRSWET